MPSGLSTFALVALGLLIGLLVAALIVAAGALAYSATLQRREAKRTAAAIARILTTNTSAINLLRTEVVGALARMDADRLHDASIGVQRGAKRLVEAVNMLYKIAYTSTTNAEIDGPLPPGLDEEAADDAARMGDRLTGTETPQEHSPWHYLSEQERRQRVNDFFAQKRAQRDPNAPATTTMEALAQQADAIRQSQGSLHTSALPDLDDEMELDTELNVRGSE
jgi:hypothetical protein